MANKWSNTARKYVIRKRLGDMKLELTFQETLVDGGGSASLEGLWPMGRDP